MKTWYELFFNDDRDGTETIASANSMCGILAAYNDAIKEGRPHDDLHIDKWEGEGDGCDAEPIKELF